MPAGITGSDCYERGLLLKKVKIFDMALKEFQQATTDPQQAGKAFAQMALCLQTLGRNEEAVTAFRRALETGSFSSRERVHIQYMLAQMLDSLDREFEALVVYRRIRREHPNFQDVDARIQKLSSGKFTSRRPVTARPKGDVVTLWQHIKPQLTSALSQTWERLARYADIQETDQEDPMPTTARGCSSPPPDRSLPAHEGETNRRRHGRIVVHMLSQFSSKTSIVAGEGELRDLSPSGCRITSPVRVPVGATVECWIYPQDGNPFAVDEATVRWIGHREFGLLFTKIRGGVHRQISDMCRRMAPL
jgi:tetratricopeptide (TPR) repeat protein